MCTYVYHESAHKWFRIYILTFSLLFLGLTMTTSFYLSPIQILIRWIESIYNHPLCEVAVLYKTLLSHGLLTGFSDWYMYIYMYGWERWRHHVIVWLYVFGEKWLDNETLTFYSFCFSFHLEVTWYLCVFHLWYRRNWCQSENLCYIIWYLERNNCVVKTLFIVCLLLQRGMTTSGILLITFWYSTFIRTFIQLTKFHSV